MKKRLVYFMAAAVIAWGGVSSFAHAGIFEEEVSQIQKNNNSTKGAISIKYEEPAPSDRYRVEIKWGNMEFRYQPADRVWDTKELKWKTPTENDKGTWKTKDGKIIKSGIPKVNVMIKNYSSNAVTARFLSDGKDFTRNVITLENGTTLELAKGNPKIPKAKENPDPDKSGTASVARFVIALGGEPEVPLDEEFQTIIPVTCIINAAK